MKKRLLLCVLAAFLLAGCTPVNPKHHTVVADNLNVTVSSSEIINNIPEINQFMDTAVNMYGECSYVSSEGDNAENLTVRVRDKKYGFEYDIISLGINNSDAYGNSVGSETEIVPLYEAGYIGMVNKFLFDTYRTIEEKYSHITIDEVCNLSSMPVIYYDDADGLDMEECENAAKEVAETFKATATEYGNASVIEYDYYTVRVKTVSDNLSVGYINMDDLSWVQR